MTLLNKYLYTGSNSKERVPLQIVKHRFEKHFEIEIEHQNLLFYRKDLIVENYSWLPSLLPTQNQDEQQRRVEFNELLVTKCTAKLRGIDINFIFRDGTRDSLAFQTEGLQVSTTGVRRLMSNIPLSPHVALQRPHVA